MALFFSLSLYGMLQKSKFFMRNEILNMVPVQLNKIHSGMKLEVMKRLSNMIVCMGCAEFSASSFVLFLKRLVNK